MSEGGGFYKGPNDTFEIGLNIYQIGVYTYLTRCANNKKSAFPSYATIADKCGISKPKAISTVAELEQMGLVEKQIRISEGRNKTNTYKVVFAQKGKHGLPLKVNGVNPCSKQDLPNKELIYKELREEEQLYIALSNDDHVFIEIYLKHFKRKKRKNHHLVSEKQQLHIMSQIYNLESFAVSEQDWEEQVIEHFQNLPARNNGNILAFIQASHRYFEVYMYDQY